MTASVGSRPTGKRRRADAGGAGIGGVPRRCKTRAKGCEDWPAMTTDGGRRLPRKVLREQRSRILSLLAERGGRDVRVFGSLARGDDDTQSDIDLLIELPDGDSAAAEL